ncbi:MAG: hypothetical protein DMF63_05015 [Acidobacteria bacterium]|nr:MAG: hypothetical protein DMF63_05015 [Acidobacteriota bacterium]
MPGRGLRLLRVTQREEPHLHEVLTDLSLMGLRNLSIESDVTSREIELLEECGGVVTPDSIPEMPLFACQLDEVEAHPDLPDRLIVDPTFEFQPFDLANFRSWIHARHFSPYQATVWVTDAFTGIKWGHWLTTAQAEIVGELKPGTEPPNTLTRELASKLFTAGVLIDPELSASLIATREKSMLAESFARDGYVVIYDVIPAAQLRALQTFYRKFCGQGFMPFGDAQVPLRFARNDEAVASHLHLGLTTLMNRLAPAPVKPTYVYSAVYIEGSELAPHVDRAECIYSFSLQLDFTPEPKDGVSPWALYISPNSPTEADPEKDRAINLPNGSCLVYKGADLMHYRTPLPEGCRSTSLFFHYIPA